MSAKNGGARPSSPLFGWHNLWTAPKYFITKSIKFNLCHFQRPWCHFQRPCVTFWDTTLHLNNGFAKPVTFTDHSSIDCFFRPYHAWGCMWLFFDLQCLSGRQPRGQLRSCSDLQLFTYTVYEYDALECKVQQTLRTNFALLYTRFGLVDTGGKGYFLMILSGLVSIIQPSSCEFCRWLTTSEKLWAVDNSHQRW